MVPRFPLASPPPDQVRADLLSLVVKYKRMRALREAHDVDVADGRGHRPDKRALQELSLRYPGVLAETDRISLELLDARLAEIEALRGRPGIEGLVLPSWIRGWLGVHRGLRGALALKAWLAGRRSIDASTRAALTRELDALRFADDARIWLDDLELIADPPRGRLVDLVFDRVGDELGIDRVTLRQLLMPRPQPREPTKRSENLG